MQQSLPLLRILVFVWEVCMWMEELVLREILLVLTWVVRRVLLLFDQ